MKTRPDIKPNLRLVKAEPPAAPESSEGDGKGAAQAPPAPKSNLARFMAAYADAIDRDIQLLLDL